MAAVVLVVRAGIQVALPQPEAANPSSMPRLAARATRIRDRTLNLGLGTLRQHAVVLLNNMLKQVAKVTKINNIFV